MDNKELELKVKELEGKMVKLFEYEKELNKELKRDSADTAEIREEIKVISNKMNELSEQVNALMKGHTVVVKNKNYSDEYIYKIRMSSSINKAAAALGISKSTVQRACHRYTSKILDDMEV